MDRISGQFLDAANRRVMPVGVNYWPASSGVEMWPRWPEDEIRADLDLVASLGLNCIRFFLRWQDFEPAPGRFNPEAFSRLDDLLRWHRERGLLAHPAFFVGFMSGGVFWPEWHRGRNIYADPELRRHAAEFAAKAAACCSRHPDTVLAIDLGNELSCLPDCLTARPAEVAHWCATVSEAIRREFPPVLIVSGSEQTQVNMDTGWRLGEQPGCDFHSMHTYPVSTWHSLAFDGMTDPLAQSLLPFYVKCARAWGPVMVQEFGTLLTRGQDECNAYLRAVLPACRRAGADGFLWWCLRDITYPGHPYDKYAFEGQLGLVDAAGQVKPALRYFLEFARALLESADGATTGGTEPSGCALYWPKEYYLRDNARNPGNDPAVLSRQLAIAHFALDQIGAAPRVVRHPSELGPGETLVIAGAKLTATEVIELDAWVRRGGRLVWQGPDALTWGAGLITLLGAEPLDFLAPRPRRIHWLGRPWDFTLFPRDIFLKVRLIGARILAQDENGDPFLFGHAHGQGSVVTCLADVDRQFAASSNLRAGREPWTTWYHGLLAAVSTGMSVERKPS